MLGRRRFFILATMTCLATSPGWSELDPTMLVLCIGFIRRHPCWMKLRGRSRFAVQRLWGLDGGPGAVSGRRALGSAAQVPRQGDVAWFYRVALFWLEVDGAVGGGTGRMSANPGLLSSRAGRYGRTS